MICFGINSSECFVNKWKSFSEDPKRREPKTASLKHLNISKKRNKRKLV
jgi:hypothetical protein